jgi:hypothetical protein
VARRSLQLEYSRPNGRAKFVPDVQDAPGRHPTRFRKAIFMRSLNLSLALALSIGVGVSATACSDSSATGDVLEAVSDTVDGVARLTYPEAGAPALPWSLDTAAVIGGYEAAGEEYQFDQVGPGSLAGNAASDLFVIDQTGKRVLGYDREGTWLGSWGREGSGPGELQRPVGLGVGRGDTLWVLDGSNQRVTLLPREPESEPTSIPFPPGSSMMGGRIIPVADGAYGVFAMFSFRPGDDAGPPPRPLVRLGRDGTASDTVWEAPAPKFDQVEVTSGNRVMVMMAQQSFAPGFHWARFSDGRFALVDGPEYDIRILGSDGIEQLRIRRDPPARATTPEDEAFERDRLREASVGGNVPGAEQMMEKRLEALTFAEVVPRITGLLVDDQDRLWAGVSVNRPGETDRIDVYAPDGALLGEIRAPEFFPDLLFGEGRVARLTADDLDVQQIVVYQLVEGGSAAD